MLEESVVDGCCREVLEKRVGMCCRGAPEKRVDREVEKNVV